MSFSRNTAANLAGRLWTVALGIVLIPIYINQLGIESYALVGFYGTLQAIFGLLDFGLGATFSREVARLSALEGGEQEQRDLLATFNVVYWFLAIVVAFIIWLIAPLIATKWIHAEKISVSALVMSIRLIGVAIGLQFPVGLYQGGLLGLQRQVEYNALLVSTATVRGVGVMVVLWFISSTVQAFFIWQVILTLLTVWFHWIVLNRVLPQGSRNAVFSFALMTGVSAYAAGWMGNTVGIAIAQQLDKIILSKTLPLEQLGYYTLAGTAASLLWTIIASVSSAAFPRFNQRVAVGDEIGLAEDYERANQLLATIVIPVSTVLIFFSRDVMTLWTRRPAVAAATEHLVVLFVLGMTLIGLANVALHVALSYSWFRLTLGFTWGTAIASAPLFWIASRWWGSLGAAVVWMLQNAAYLLLVPLLHRRYLRGGAVKWLKQALIVPAAVSCLVCGIARLIAPTTDHPVVLAATLACTWGIATLGVAFVEPTVRVELTTLWARMRAVPDGA